LFKIGVHAGAVLNAPTITVGFDGNGNEVLEKIEDWIPQLELELAAQFREEIGLVGDGDRRAYLRRSRELPGHPARALLRSLATIDGMDILDQNFSFEPCPVNGGANACAKITNVALVIEKVKDLVESILGKVADGADGYMDDVLKPIEKLNAPIPGISEISGRDITVLDIAEIFVGESSGADTVRKILKIYSDIVDVVQGSLESFGQDNLLLASECDLLNGFSCSGGLSDDVDNDNRRMLGLKDDLVQKAEGIAEGLEFPVLTNPVSALNLLRGDDIVSKNVSS
jgi:hypothetical protein